MSDALHDVREEFSRIYGTDPDEPFETLLSRVWRDGYDQGRSDAFSEIADYIQEIR